MILLDQGTLNGVPIKKWEVWFRTMHGLHKTLDEALVSAAATDMPVEMIRAVPVALDEGGNYEERMN